MPMARAFVAIWRRRMSTAALRELEPYLLADIGKTEKSAALSARSGSGNKKPRKINRALGAVCRSADVDDYFLRRSRTTYIDARDFVAFRRRRRLADQHSAPGMSSNSSSPSTKK